MDSAFALAGAIFKGKILPKEGAVCVDAGARTIRNVAFANFR